MSDPATEPVRVAVWGTGRLGTACIRAIERMPELVLTAALSYDDAKRGRDAGEVAGIDPVGVVVTTDRAEVLASEAECVLYVAMDFGDWRSDADLLELLESGKNVVTSLPYKNLKWRGTDVAEQFATAATQGGVTFYASGVDPDFVSERMVLTASGLCGEVDHIHVRELFRCDTIGAEVFAIAGFGTPVDDEGQRAFLAGMTANYSAPSMAYVAERMGRPLDRIVPTVTSHPAPVDIDVPQAEIRAGTTAMLTIRHDGYSDGDIFYSLELCYFLTDVMRPAEATVDECWFVTIEGRPSVRVTLEGLASAATGALRYDDDPTPPGYYLTATPLLQAIPAVVAAAPGVRDTFGADQLHWKRDLRDGLALH